jgi:excinuclease ABC subunit C
MPIAKKDTSDAVMVKKLENKVAALPLKPGVYIFKDDRGEVIYVGKAIKLRSRVRSYFRSDSQASVKTQVLVKHIADLEYIVVRGEVEALVLENNLIKKYRPRYNIRLRDDKNYQYVKITAEDFPQVVLVRKIENDGARYFGPYTSGLAIKHTIELLEKIFPYRKCKHNFYDQPDKPRNPQGIRPCVQLQIGRCIGICKEDVSQDEHQEIIKHVTMFLEGKEREIVRMLETKMNDASEEMNFEYAAKVRNQIREIEVVLEKQQAVMTDLLDRDVFAIALGGTKAVVALLKVRKGLLIGTDRLNAESTEVGGETEADVAERIMLNYYEQATDIPQEILVNVDFESRGVLGDLLTEIRTAKGLRATQVRVDYPQRGEKKQLVELATENARQALEDLLELHLNKQQRITKGLHELQDALKLDHKPKRIECYDISHLGGQETVGSMVVFVDGEQVKSHYRRFKVEIVQGGDDYAALQEVVKRRLRNLEIDTLTFGKAKKKEWEHLERVLCENKLDLEGAVYAQFLVARDGERVVGCGRIKELNPDTPLTNETTQTQTTQGPNQRAAGKTTDAYEIGSLWVDPAFRGRQLGYRLMSRLITTCPVKIVYALTQGSLASYYEGFGFKRVKSIPALFDRKISRCQKYFSDITLLRYDKKKKKEDVSFGQVPDLIVIDGGKGQLSAVINIMSTMGFLQHMKRESGVDVASTKTEGKNDWAGYITAVISLAKEREEVFVPWQSDPVALSADSQGSFLLQRIRDEAHRFALEYQRKRREIKLIP